MVQVVELFKNKVAERATAIACRDFADDLQRINVNHADAVGKPIRNINPARVDMQINAFRRVADLDGGNFFVLLEIDDRKLCRPGNW